MKSCCNRRLQMISIDSFMENIPSMLMTASTILWLIMTSSVSWGNMLGTHLGLMFHWVRRYAASMIKIQGQLSLIGTWRKKSTVCYKKYMAVYFVFDTQDGGITWKFYVWLNKKYRCCISCFPCLRWWWNWCNVAFFVSFFVFRIWVHQYILGLFKLFASNYLKCFWITIYVLSDLDEFQQSLMQCYYIQFV